MRPRRRRSTISLIYWSTQLRRVAVALCLTSAVKYTFTAEELSEYLMGSAVVMSVVRSVRFLLYKARAVQKETVGASILDILHKVSIGIFSVTDFHRIFRKWPDSLNPRTEAATRQVVSKNHAIGIGENCYDRK